MEGEQEFALSKSERKRLQRGAERDEKRFAVAEKFKIAYHPSGTIIMPRSRVGVVRKSAARAAETPFNPLSPAGLAHSWQTTSTVPRKFCTYEHAKAHFPAKQSLVHQARNLESVIAVCEEDFHYRIRSDYADSYATVSNRKAYADSLNVLEDLLRIVQALGRKGYNVGEYLDRIDQFYNTLLEAKHALNIRVGKRRDEVVTPVKMAPLV